MAIKLNPLNLTYYKGWQKRYRRRTIDFYNEWKRRGRPDAFAKSIKHKIYLLTWHPHEFTGGFAEIIMRVYRHNGKFIYEMQIQTKAGRR